MGKQATDRSTDPLTRHRPQPRALPSSCLSTNLRGELPPLLFIERRREFEKLSKQLPTLVGKTQIFYLVKEFALFRSKNRRFWGVLGRFWGVFGAFWGVLGRFGRFGAFFERFWAFMRVQKMRPLFFDLLELN